MSRLKQIEKEIQDLGKRKLAISTEMKALSREADLERAKEKLQSMPEAERKAISQIISEAGGIESKEKVSDLKTKK